MPLKSTNISDCGVDRHFNFQSDHRLVYCKIQIEKKRPFKPKTTAKIEISDANLYKTIISSLMSPTLSESTKSKENELRIR